MGARINITIENRNLAHPEVILSADSRSLEEVNFLYYGEMLTLTDGV